jgi:WD40 repeat protein
MSRIAAKYGAWQQWQVVCGRAYSWNACESILTGHSNSVESVAFSQNGKRIVSGSYDQTVRIWNVETGEEERKLKGHSDSVISVAFSQDGKRIVSGSGDETVRIWNVETEEEERKLEGHSDSVISVAFSQDGKRIVSGSGDETVRIWNVETGEEKTLGLQSTDCSLPIQVSDWAISFDGQRCYIATPRSNISAITSHISAVCFGNENGHIIILKKNNQIKY